MSMENDYFIDQIASPFIDAVVVKSAPELLYAIILPSVFIPNVPRVLAARLYDMGCRILIVG